MSEKKSIEGPHLIAYSVMRIPVATAAHIIDVLRETHGKSSDSFIWPTRSDRYVVLVGFCESIAILRVAEFGCPNHDADYCQYILSADSLLIRYKKPCICM